MPRRLGIGGMGEVWCAVGTGDGPNATWR